MSDKRQYVRIEAHLPVQYRIIKDEEFEEARNRCLEKRLVNHEENFSHTMKEFDLETTTNPQSLISEGMDPLTAKVFGEIDRKLNLLLRLLVDNRISGINHDIFHEVNLSGGGCALRSSRKSGADLGGLLLLLLLLCNRLKKRNIRT